MISAMATCISSLDSPRAKPISLIGILRQTPTSDIIDHRSRKTPSLNVDGKTLRKAGLSQKSWPNMDTFRFLTRGKLNGF